MRRLVSVLAAGLVAALLAGPVAAQQPAPVATSPAATSPVAASPAAAPADGAAPAAATPMPIGTTEAGAHQPRALAVPHELSPWSMFMSADIVVKAVMIGLAFASLATWTIFIAKFVEQILAQRRLRGALEAIEDARSIAEARQALGSQQSVLATFLAAGLREARLSAGISSDSGIKERAASSFAEISRAEARRMRFGMGVLATIGATAPFVGLFGTVWGIMNSFIGISKAQTTNLAVVAPGIAEALLATAIGLFAAIPALVAYNKLQGDVARIQARLESFADEFSAILSRQIDQHAGNSGRDRAA